MSQTLLVITSAEQVEWEVTPGLLFRLASNLVINIPSGGVCYHVILVPEHMGGEPDLMEDNKLREGWSDPTH